MGVISIPDSGGLMIPKSFPVYYGSGTGITKAAGTAYVAQVSKTGSGVDVNNCSPTAIASATASDFTNLVSITGKYHIRWKNNTSTSLWPLKIGIAAAEDATDAIRCQVLVDGVMAFDETVTKSAGNVFDGIIDANTFVDFDVKSSFIVRACRYGTMADATNTYIYVGDVYATELQ